MKCFHTAVFGDLFGSTLRHSVGLNVISNIPIDDEDLNLRLRIRRSECCDPGLLQAPASVFEIDRALVLINLEAIHCIGRQALTEIRVLPGTFYYKCVHGLDSLRSARSG